MDNNARLDTKLNVRRLFATSRAHTHRRLEAIVNPPLEASECTDHDYTRTETFRGEVGNANFARDLANTFTLVRLLTHLRDERVSGVGDDGANDTGEVTGSEGDTELRALAVLGLGLRENVRVEEGDDLLEEIELGHRVRDLTRPERDD